MKKNKVKALYIHIPFCEHICSYCDFPKLQYFSNFVDLYLQKLADELAFYDLNDFETIYIGGGTPSSLSVSQLETLLKIVEPYSKKVKEYTFEANPESLNKDKIVLLSAYKVNRVSLGVQSTNDTILSLLNRKHTFLDVKNVIEELIKQNITNINVDLILGLPQTNEKLLKIDLEKLTELPIKHISCYSLTVSPHTTFYIKGVKPASDEKMREYYELVNNYLSKKGFIHYEVSNWSKEGFESKHNLTYWKNEQYLGIGMGAAGYIDNIRYRNTHSINDYLNGTTLVEKEELTLKDDKTYFIMLTLRTRYGLSLSNYNKKFKENLLFIKKEQVNNLLDRKLIKIYKNRIIPTFEGMMLLDEIILELM